MRILTTAVKRPHILATGLLVGWFLLLAAGCGDQRPAAPAGPTPREVELAKTVADLRNKLSAAEHEVELAKAETALAQKKLESALAPQTNAETETVRSARTETKIADTSYTVVKKTFTPGQLISRATSSNPSATERRPAEFRIIFKGVQSGKEYPALEVQESAYNQFLEGLAYPPQAINAAKKTSSTGGGATASPAGTGGGTVLSAAEASAIFSN